MLYVCLFTVWIQNRIQTHNTHIRLSATGLSAWNTLTTWHLFYSRYIHVYVNIIQVGVTMQREPYEPTRQKTYLRAYMPGEDSDQNAHSRTLIRIFTGPFWIANDAYSETCVREPPLRLTLNSGWCGKSCLSYKGICHVILLAKLHDMYLYKTATFPHQPLKSISTVAFLYRFHCRFCMRRTVCSDNSDAQADLSLCLAHISEGTFSHVAAHIINNERKWPSSCMPRPACAVIH